MVPCHRPVQVQATLPPSQAPASTEGHRLWGSWEGLGAQRDFPSSVVCVKSDTQLLWI